LHYQFDQFAEEVEFDVESSLSGFANHIIILGIVSVFTAAAGLLVVFSGKPLVMRVYPGYLIWGRSLIRLALAAVLYFLRPRETLEGQS
jgi:hypothetical protein